MDQPHTPGLLQSIFGGGAEGPKEDMFAHPHEKHIIESAIDILKESETGAHLLGVGYAKKIKFHVFKNRNAHGYSPELTDIYIGAPPEQSEPDPYLILEMGAALRNIEQEYVGFTMPPEGTDPLHVAATRHAKFLDIVVFMCKIGHELSRVTDSDEYIKAIEALGHGEILKAHLAQSGQEEMVDAYYKAHEKVK